MPLPVPSMILLAMASIGVLLCRFLRVRSDRICGTVMVLAIVLTAIVLACTATTALETNGEQLPPTPWIVDPLSIFEQGIVLLLGLLTSLAAFDSRDAKHGSCSSRGLILFIIGGLMLVASANDFISLGLSLEILNLAVWGLEQETSSPPDQPCSSERSGSSSDTSRQRIWLTATGAALMWLGIALLANAVATTRYDVIRFVLTNSYAPAGEQTPIGTPSKLILLSAGLIVLGLVIRIGLFAFSWNWHSRDQNAADWRTGFLVAVGQLSGSIALTRLLGTVFVGLESQLAVLVMSASLATFAVGAILAIRALSSGVRSTALCLTSLTLVSSAWLGAGLMTITIELSHPGSRWGAFPGQNESLAIIVFAQLATVCAGGGLAWTIGHLSWNDRPIQFLEDLRGLGQRSPLAAASLAIGALSVIGCPLTATFWSRWLLLLAGHNAHWKSPSNLFTPHEGLRMLFLVGIASTAVVSVTVIRLGREMFFEPQLSRPIAVGGRGLLAAGSLSAATCVLLGIVPDLALKPLSLIPSPRTTTGPAEPKGSGGNSVGTMTNLFAPQ